MKSLVLLLALLAFPALAEGVCVPAGQWQAGSAPLAADAALQTIRANRVLLLGEKHATPAHHQWHAQTIRALLDSGQPVVIGIEYLPRSMQSVLDQWVAGELTPEAFFEKSRWAELWRHDFDAYRPLFDLARERKIPMLALNIDRDFIRQVSREGFDKAAAGFPGGAPVGKPAEPDPAYAQSLTDVFRQHAREASPEAVARFIAAQTVWDRAFAEGLRDALAAHPGALAVGVMGQGHVENGHGAAHQLRALGLPQVLTAVPAAGCDTPATAGDLLYGAG
ncbi:ChaN family lipoprotein [Sandaracinobacter sp. RS1-74]|uniref:ChaN family lipoprotein n=1 Tax=Sandaracinobacteroides sayramensis TaxID=2913411 RepID=UPI001EDBA066|nr:ChaN family lipoprotein [Sandaracinobacteroides sayramensis]MCG2840499.1 ChaN family lipoprotein [Sandaracinobacteroides sayramensis]